MTDVVNVDKCRATHSKIKMIFFNTKYLIKSSVMFNNEEISVYPLIQVSPLKKKFHLFITRKQ